MATLAKMNRDVVERIGGWRTNRLCRLSCLFCMEKAGRQRAGNWVFQKFMVASLGFLTVGRFSSGC
jgi:hypothetical protein